MDAVLPGGGFLRCGAEAIEPFQDRDRLEPHSFENLDHLCLRQSAGDSTCPEVDVPPRVFGEFDVKEDIGQVQAAADGCTETGARAMHAVCDVTDAGQVAHTYREIVQTLGPPDILVNNAGWARSAPFLKETIQSVDDHIQVNLHGAFHAAQAALPAMLEKRWGRIVVVASVAGKVGTPYTAAYTASKHAAVGLTRALASEFAEKGVTVNAVCPGYTDTELTRENIRRAAEKTGKSVAEMHERFKSFSPQGRFTTPEEVAHVVLFLCSEAAGNINGQAITIDGGGVQW